MLPALLLVLDPPWRARGRVGKWLLAHGMPVAVVLGYLIVRRSLFGVATADLPALVGGAEVTAGHGRDLVTQLSTIATVLPRALAQCVVPLGLTLDPDIVFTRTPWDPAVIAGAVFVLALTWLGLRRPATGPARAFGTTLAWASALPWVILPLNSPYLEHRMYGPLAGLALVAAHSLSGVRLTLPAWRCGVAAAALALSALAALRSHEYRDARVLWERVVTTQPGSVRGLCGLALCHMERAELEPALRLLERAVAIWPGHEAALRNLTELHILLSPEPGRALAAVVLSDRLVAAEPNNPFDRLLSSRALAAMGAETGDASWFDAAEAQALACLEIAPPKGLVFRTAASARARQGRLDLALALLDRSVAMGLAHSSVLIDRASYLNQLGRHAEAEQDLARAASGGPFDPRVIELLRARGAGPGR
ncbi:MAG: tetratricopeptide repeat protein [Phycisphaerales bacterium]|nr:tetratricopeptide repeat protein [Phycisphaerales bacterium]